MLAAVEPTGAPQFDTGADNANYVHTKRSGYKSIAQAWVIANCYKTW